MGIKTVQDSSLTAVADAIRAKTGKSASMEFPSEFVSEIGSIETGGGGRTDREWMSKTVSGSVTYNGTTFPIMLDGFASITSFEAPNLTNLYNANYMFRNCTSLETISMPKLERMFGVDFFRATLIQTLVLPKLGTGKNALQGIIAGKTFYNCSRFKALDCEHLATIQSNGFQNASVFDTLIIRTTSYTCTLSDISGFAGTPFASDGSGGTLYVPQSRISSYESATNWSTILGYANNSIQAIEGSIYETQYADGTPIPTT